MPVHYCFVVGGGEEGAGPGSVFEFEKTRGVVPALLETHVKIVFRPTMPANYYKRVFCLVENQHPLYMDLFGSGYIPAKGKSRA
jgi:cilia- and flagella-associated protein 65